MPLFRSTRADPVATDPVVNDPVANDVPARRRSLFSRRQPVTTTTGAPVTSPTTAAAPASPTRRGFFGRRRSSDSSLSDSSGRRARRNHTAAAAGTTAGATTGFFGASKLRDPTLDAARGKVQAAELAEREADKALVAARAAVTEAKRHVAILEREANEQARLAQEKVLAARGIKSDAGHLGRHS